MIKNIKRELIFNNFIICIFCVDFKRFFQMDIIKETENYSTGYLYINFENFQNFSIFLNRNYYNWFLNKKGKICESLNFDPKFSLIRFHISEKKLKSVILTEIDPCCKL